MSEPGQPGASNIDPDFPQRRRPRIPSAAFARSQVSGPQEDLIPGSWFLAPPLSAKRGLACRGAVAWQRQG